MTFELPEKGDLVFYTKAGLVNSSAGAMSSFIGTKTPLLVLGFKELSQQIKSGSYTWLFPWEYKRWGLHCLVETKVFHLVLYPKDIKLKDMLIVVKASRKNDRRIQIR